MAYPDQEEVVRFSIPQEDGSIVTYERSGYCCRCGECCVGDPSDGTIGEPAVEGYCPLYRILPDMKGWCSDREHMIYKQGCNVWPTNPNQISDKPSCTYQFKVVEE